MVAYELRVRRGYDISCICIDKEGSIVRHASGRNSGVIHSGIHSKPDTLKARLCVRGNRLMYRLCDTLEVPYRRGGMLIVGDDNSRVEELERRARANGVEYHILFKDRIKALEPYVKATQGLYIPSAGVTDPYRLAYTLYDGSVAAGVKYALNSKVEGIEFLYDRFRLITNNSNHNHIDARIVINSAGAYSDEIATLVGLKKYRIHPCLGEYYIVRDKPHLVNSLIYPLPTFDYRGLGIHITKRLDGTISIGPNAVYLRSKEEQHTSSSEEFYTQASMLIDGLEEDDLIYGYSGVRARLVGEYSKEEPDFIIEEYPYNFIHLIGIESPGFTSSPAIAEYVADMLKDRL